MRKATRDQVTEARERVWAAFDEMDQDKRFTNMLAITQFTDLSKISEKHFARKIPNYEALRDYQKLEREIRQTWIDPTFGRQVGEHVFWRGEDGSILQGTLRGITRDGDQAYAAVEAIDNTFHAGPLRSFLSHF